VGAHLVTGLPDTGRRTATPAARPSGEDDPFGAFLPRPRLHVPASGAGPLDGLGFAVQDLIDIQGAVTGAGNPDWAAAQRPAVRSATAVEKCRAAGATMVGKTVTDELGFSLEGSNPHYGAPINPHDRNAMAGGSAAGSAVAVAAGLADFALGVDSAGSVRTPAAFCGLWGFRPSMGRVSTDGITPFVPSFDTIGWVARTPQTLRAVGLALLEEDADDTPLTDLRVARDAVDIAAPDLAASVARIASEWPCGAPMQAFAGLWHDHLRLYAHAQAADLSTGLGRQVSALRVRLGVDAAQRFAAAMAAAPSAIEA
jgi:amidase